MGGDEIRKCRFCGIHTEFDVQDLGDDSFRAICKTCGTQGPVFRNVFGAIEAWQEMMAPRAHDPIMAFDKDGNVRMLEQERSYRDRVDMMAAAIVAYRGTDRVDEMGVARVAISQIDAIDAALKER